MNCHMKIDFNVKEARSYKKVADDSSACYIGTLVLGFRQVVTYFTFYSNVGCILIAENCCKVETPCDRGKSDRKIRVLHKKKDVANPPLKASYTLQ